MYLVNGEKKGKGFWKIGTSKNQNPLDDNKFFIECYRKELIGQEACKSVMKAIALNITSLVKECRQDGYLISDSEEGISYEIPLVVLESIYDFWLDLYRDHSLFNKVYRLLTTRRHLVFKELLEKKILIGFSAKWMYELEKLHSFRPPSSHSINFPQPMWYQEEERCSKN